MAAEPATFGLTLVIAHLDRSTDRGYDRHGKRASPRRATATRKTPWPVWAMVGTLCALRCGLCAVRYALCAMRYSSPSRAAYATAAARDDRPSFVRRLATWR